MTKLGLVLLLGSSLLGNLRAQAAQLAPKAPKRLTLRVYDNAKLHPFILRLARKQTSRIFRRVGVETGWLDCPAFPQPIPANPACLAPLGPAEFVVRILPESISKKYGLPKDVFGFTLPATKGRIGRTVNVFHGRVSDMAYYGPIGGSFETAQGTILGHVIAHEIGHILLEPGSHSEKGIMSFPWGRKHLVDASRGLLRFNLDQTKRILSRLDDLSADRH